MRTACLRVADLPLAAELRAHPELRGRPFAVAGGRGPRAELLSVSPEAARAGVRRGATVAHARSVCAALAVRVASPALEQAARDALLDAACACTPRAALAPRALGAFATEAAVLADASGCTALHRSEAGFASALAARARALGLPADVAVAASGDVARIAARQLELARRAPGVADEGRGLGGLPPDEGRVLVLPPGREAAFLAPLPVDLLDPDDALAEALTRFGVQRVRDLLALPRRGLATRLGAGALELVLRASGRASEPPLPEPRDARLAEAIDLEAPVERLDALLFAVQGLLSRLLERLDARHLGCGDLALSFDLDGGGRDARTVGVAAPTGDLRVLMRLVRLALEARPPAAALVGVRVETEGRAAERDQLDLFRPAGPAPAALAETLAALHGWCGEARGAARVGAPAVADAHHPDAVEVVPFPARRPGGEPPPAPAAGASLRALRPPLAAQVEQRRQSPVRVRSAVANGRIVRCAGPWRSSGGWWSPEGRFAFDSYDVQTEDGLVVRLRFDHVRRAWQIDAVYD